MPNLFGIFLRTVLVSKYGNLIFKKYGNLLLPHPFIPALYKLALEGWFREVSFIVLTNIFF